MTQRYHFRDSVRRTRPLFLTCCGAPASRSRFCCVSHLISGIYPVPHLSWHTRASKQNFRRKEETSDPTHQAPLQLLHSGGGLLKSLVGPRDSWEPTCPCPVAPIALDSCCPSDRPYLPFHALSPSETIPRHSRPTTLERKRQHRFGKPVKGKQNSPMRSIFPCLPAYRVLAC